ncbi:MAG: OsmC family protein [Thermoplasmata archaeon]|nr:MAG: OsmC family protein [Thermoplasmata archaeon]
MELKPREYKYETNLVWTGEHKGDLSSPDKPMINVACPPEWGGHEGIWSPEDLFVASIELCTMTTFLWLLDKNDLQIKSYKSSAVGTAKMVQNSFIFSDIVVEPHVQIYDKKHREKVEKLFDECKKWCLITKSVKSNVTITPTITAESD